MNITRKERAVIMKRKLYNEKGFTLIELMATLAILALITLIAVPAIGNIIDNANKSAEATSIEMIERAGALADIGGLEHDVGEQYNVTSLINNGYLDMDIESELAADGYVERVDDNRSVYTYGQAVPTDVSILDFDLLDNGTYMLSGFDRPYGSDNPTDIIIPSEYNGKAVTAIGNRAFDSKNLTSVKIPNSIETIGNGAFSSNNLTTVTIPGNTKIIGMEAFAENQLTSLTINEGVTDIQAHAFAFNELTSVTIPNSVTWIGRYVLNVNDMTYVSISPDTDLEDLAFSGISGGFELIVRDEQ